MCLECLDEGSDIKRFEQWITLVITDALANSNEVRMKTLDGQTRVFTNPEAVEDSHYKAMAFEPNDFITANNLGWCEGNIIKYICRHKRKGGADDIRKIIRYAEYILTHEYGENDK